MNLRPFSLLCAATFAALSAAPRSAGAQEQAGPPLPLRQVVLFSSGVGYFERAGRVNGETKVDLAFRADQVNDILKSLVIFDPAGGVRPVSYTTRDPATRQLREIGAAADPNASLGALLRRFQGARVRLQAFGETIEGRIISVSLKQVPVQGGGVAQTEVLNVLTDAGLRAVPLDQANQVRLLDERLDRDLRASLELLASGLDDRQRTVELRFAGGGAREVRAAYLQEMPVWKTTYRLVLDPREKPYLQGWAIVENTSDEDWGDVRLSLVSGRPVSFIQDLYQPLYVPRPQVAPQVVGSPTPQIYGETLERGYADAPAAPPPAGAMGGLAAPGQRGRAASDKRVTVNLRGIPLRDALELLFQGSGLQYAVDPNVPNVLVSANLRDQPITDALRTLLRQVSPQAPGVTFTEDNGIYVIKIRAPIAPPVEGAILGLPLDNSLVVAGVQAMAQGAERGELFEYAIKQPVTIAKQQAAMVPILGTNVEGERLSIYDPESDARHALNGFRLKNTTGLHLAGGPVTVFQAGGYAGDAQITNLQPGEERLLSYAVDLELVADREAPKTSQETLSISAKSGVLTITRKQRQEQTYTFRNKAAEAKTVLVQQRKDAEFRVVEPAKPAETTADHLRFLVPVAAGKTATLKVVTERPVTETFALLDADLNFLLQQTRNTQLSPRLKAALEQLVQHRRKITDLQAQRAALEAELNAITQEQSRIRQNMAQLDRNSPLYQQYVRKLTDQEATIEKHRAEIARLREAEQAAEKEMRGFVERITAE